jgi:hypothetical protein
MSSESDNRKSLNLEENNEFTNLIGLGGFPPIMFLGTKNKKIKQFSQLNNNNDNIKNISKLNILNIKNILGV